MLADEFAEGPGTGVGRAGAGVGRAVAEIFGNGSEVGGSAGFPRCKTGVSPASVSGAGAAGGGVLPVLLVASGLSVFVFVSAGLDVELGCPVVEEDGSVVSVDALASVSGGCGVLPPLCRSVGGLSLSSRSLGSEVTFFFLLSEVDRFSVVRQVPTPLHVLLGPSKAL